MSGASNHGRFGASRSRIGRFRRRLLADTGGNTLALAASAALILMIAVGGGIDMSRGYLTKTSLQAGCDAGVLAGRRALLKSGVYSSAEKARADMMFNANMTPKQTQALNVTFKTDSHSDGSVSGEAAATMPFVILSAFGFPSTDLKVACSAELQMASADVMFVLDTTGSMAGSRIAGLREAVREFHKTVFDAVISKNETIIRYGFVPYSMTVNARDLVASGAMRTDWFADAADYQTKVAKFDDKDYIPLTTDVAETYEVLGSVNKKNQCSSWSVPKSSTSGTQPSKTTDTSYKTLWTSGECRIIKTATTNTWQTVWKFSGWTNQKASVPTKGLVGSGSLSIISGTPSTSVSTFAYTTEQGVYDMRTLAKMVDEGTAARMPSSTSSTWSGCIEERQTVVNYAMNPVPAAALDLNINDAPREGDDATKWKPYWAGNNGILRNRSGNTLSESCPSPMRQFETVDTTTPELPAAMNAYINGLVATGNTYHDIGMIWGARLASTRGMFSANVLEGDRKSVSRHIIFMTDGDMEPSSSGYNAYGIETLDNRIAPPGTPSGKNSLLAKYHNSRFVAACLRAREEGYTIWVIGFGASISNEMKTCASADRYYFANSTEELKNAFRYIAGQVADLRLKR